MCLTNSFLSTANANQLTRPMVRNWQYLFQFQKYTYLKYLDFLEYQMFKGIWIFISHVNPCSVLFNKAQSCDYVLRTLESYYSPPLVFEGVGSRTHAHTHSLPLSTPLYPTVDTKIQGCLSPSYRMAQYLHIGYSRVCLPTTSFVWIQYSTWRMANSNFAFWIFLGFWFFVVFFPNIFDPQLVESVHAKPTDVEG